MKKLILAAVAASAIAVSAAVPAMAQAHSHDSHGEAHDDHHGHDMSEPEGDDSTSSRAFAEANARMHEAMDIDYSGDADVDFVRGMIAHHVGAIEMARVVIEHGEDPEIRALAKEIIEAQEAEVEMMEGWLEERGHR